MSRWSRNDALHGGIRRRRFERSVEIWSRAENKRLVTAAAREIERNFAVDAQRKGIDYHEGLRTIVVARLRAIYEVSVDDRKVIVWRMREVE